MTHGNITFVIVLLVARYVTYLSFQFTPFILLILGWLGCWALDADDTSWIKITSRLEVKPSSAGSAKRIYAVLV